MEIKQLKKSNKNIYIVTLDNHTEFPLYDDLIVKYELIPKKKITEKQLLEIQNEQKKLESYYKAINYITIRLRSKKELQKYLEKCQYSKEAIQKTIAKLEKEGYLNEKEYQKAYVNDTFRFQNDGPLKIKRKLMEQGISEVDISWISKEDWLTKLEKLYQKKANSKHTDGLNKWKQKCEQYFMNLGYPKEWISLIENNIKWEEDDFLIQKELEKIYRKCSRKYKDQELLFQIKRKLYEKGFNREKIEEMIEIKMKNID